MVLAAQVAGLSHEITGRKQAESDYRNACVEGRRNLVRELDEAQRLKTELFNVVSHEFKTPLATIIGFSGLLAKNDQGLSDDQRAKYLATIARQAERLNRLVENIMTSARRVEARSDVSGSVEEAMDAVRAQLSETYDDVDLEIAIADGLRPLMSQEALRLVLLNLASNAVKHARADSAVRVVAERDVDVVVISVTNEGEPIPPQTLERMFEPFVHETGSGRSAEGIGLGLHIVDKLVRVHGGTVSVDGTETTVTFTIRIPEARQRRGLHDPVVLPTRRDQGALDHVPEEWRWEMAVPTKR